MTKLLKLYTKRIVKLRHGDQPEKAKMWGQQGKQQPCKGLKWHQSAGTAPKKVASIPKLSENSFASTFYLNIFF